MPRSLIFPIHFRFALAADVWHSGALSQNGTKPVIEKWSQCRVRDWLQVVQFWSSQNAESQNRPSASKQLQVFRSAVLDWSLWNERAMMHWADMRSQIHTEIQNQPMKKRTSERKWALQIRKPYDVHIQWPVSVSCSDIFYFLPGPIISVQVWNPAKALTPLVQITFQTAVLAACCWRQDFWCSWTHLNLSSFQEQFNQMSWRIEQLLLQLPGITFWNIVDLQLSWHNKRQETVGW